MEITMIGVDLAKQVFQVHGVDASGEVVVRRRLRRGAVLGFFAGLEPRVVGMEAPRDGALLGARGTGSGP
jgi:transposase